MIKQSPRRNNRSKGIKVKHVLQIILLLGVCFWLIYQVKHSHDKTKEFDENDAKVSDESHTAYQTLELGRKDLHPGKDEANPNEKHKEEEEDENILEDEDKNEHNEHEEEENELESEEKDDKHGLRAGGDVNKSNEVENERGGGDDEIDENDQEQSTVDIDRDEEKQKEEESDDKENENNRDEENDGSVENHNSHKAREENYKGDDASSAVTHDIGTTSTEIETLLKNSDVNSTMNTTKSENRSSYAEESNRNWYSSSFNITEAELPGGTSSNATSGKETGSNSLSNTVYSSHLDNITTTYSDGHFEAGSNLTAVISGGNLTVTSANTSSELNLAENGTVNATIAEDVKHLDNITTTYLDSHSEEDSNLIAVISGGNLTGTSANTSSEPNQAQNGLVNATDTEDVKNVPTEVLEQRGNRISEENLSGSKSTVPMETKKGDGVVGETSNLEGGELENTTKSVVSDETEKNSNTEVSETKNNQNISYVKENTDAAKNEFKGNTQTDETSDSSSALGTSNPVEHHDIDSSDSYILKNEAEVRTDLDTLPDIRNEGDNSDAIATG